MTVHVDVHDPKNPVHFSTSWPPIDFSGNTGSQVEINKRLFDQCDKLPSIEDGSSMSFSQQYTTFIQDLNKNLPKISADVTKQLNDSANKATTLCGSQTKALSGALPYYVSDPGLVEWASLNWPPYQESGAQCMQAETDYDALTDKLLGDNSAMFGNARIVADAMTSKDDVEAPGINMPITDAKAGAVGGAGAQYVPLYDVSLLNGTITTWIQNTNPIPAYSWSQSSYVADNSSKTTSGSGGVSFVWDDVSGSGDGSGSTTTTTATAIAQDFTLSFAGLSTMEIDHGIWFDNYRVAGAVHNPPPNDPTATATQKVFDEYFGTQSAPKGVSRYNAQMVVGFRPTWSMTLTNSSEFNQMKSASASAKVCFLFICAGGSGASSLNVTHVDEKAQSVTLADTSNNAYILGFVMSSFWNA
ncbi:hypothetical protein B0H19DRAFT_1224845 [Mycena capillaripes]|nr:hypothetical protein B0H19DRAFT_1224845 [Mycena capillaripes]